MSNIISSALIIASLGIFFGYVNPTYGALSGAAELKERSIKELVEEQERYADALNKTKEIERERTGLLEKYNAIPLEDRERIEKLLPDHIDSVRLIIDVNNIASKYGMTLRNISLTDSATEQAGSSRAIGPQAARAKEVGLKFNVTGSYDDFRSFLRDLEQSLRLVDVQSVLFTTNEEDFDYSITISTYKLNQNDNATF